MSRNFKVGLVTLLALFFLYFGFNFLKGRNIFRTTNTYYGQFEDLGGLVEGAPVFVQGFKIGQVDAVHYDFSRSPAFTLKVSIPMDIQLPQGTQMVLFDDGMIGGKAVKIVFPKEHKTAYLADNDTMQSAIEPGLFDAVAGLAPKLTATLEHTDSLVQTANQLLGSRAVKNSINNLDKIMADFAVSSAGIKQIVAGINRDLPSIMKDARATMENLNVASKNISTLDFNGLVDNVNTTLGKVDTFADKLNSGDGTVGALLNDRSLYNNLNTTIGSANALVVDLKANPRRYVHFSLFGGKDKSDKTKKSTK